MAIPAPYFYNTIFAYDGFGRRIKKDNIEFIYDNDGNLIAQSDGQNTLEFIYNAMDIIGVKYDEKQYFYRKDAQGNIIAILDSAGNVVVKYIYDCWGNHAIVAETGEDVTDGIGILNPFRYRGYYYDDETGLYYLKTRYYDPEIGRFISQDNIDYAEPETINGLNLYAYCGNNPVMNIDSTGCSWSSFWSKVGRFLGGVVLAVVGAAIVLVSLIPALINPVATVICEFGLTIGFYGAALVGSVFDSAIYSDMQLIGWNPYNQNADAATQSQKMSFYKGAPIIRANMGGGRSGSFGIIFLDKNEHDPDTVRHEFGHVPQLMMLGIFRYGVCIGIPSMNNWYKRTPWTYYEAPWDAGADYFGGVKNRPMTNDTRNRALKYMMLSYFLGPIVHSFYKNLK